MDLIHLKAPPDRVRLMAQAIERDINNGYAGDSEVQLTEVLTWLHYRLARWNAAHPDNPAA